MGLCWGKDLNSRWIRCFTAGATTSRTLRLWSSGVYSEICSQNRGLFQTGQSPGFVRRARWKSTDLAASLRQAFGDDFLLVSNEVMRSRVSVLADNIALWGDPNVVVTSVDPKAFARLEGFFDIIVTDVPCSGEGMFRKDAKAVEDWSENVVTLCSARQKRILADVWPALRRGGSLIYSTCTFEDAENDAVMEWTADELGGTVHEYDYSSLEGVIPTKTGGLLVPGFVKGEGQFVSALIKIQELMASGFPANLPLALPKSGKVICSFIFQDPLSVRSLRLNRCARFRPGWQR